jgi:hypothetical protein
MTLLKKEDFSPQRRKDHKGFLWAFSVLGVLSVLAVPFFSGLTNWHEFFPGDLASFALLCTFFQQAQ